MQSEFVSAYACMYACACLFRQSARVCTMCVLFSNTCVCILLVQVILGPWCGLWGEKRASERERQREIGERPRQLYLE